MSRFDPGTFFGGEPRTIRALLVEDHPVFLAYVSGVLASNPAVHIVGRAQDGTQAIRSAVASNPDLVLLDIGLPGINGLEVARHILRSLPKCRIIFVTQEASAEFVEEAFAIGATGYVLKTQANEDLWPAIMNVCEGKAFLSSGLEQPARLNPDLQRLATI